MIQVTTPILHQVTPEPTMVVLNHNLPFDDCDFWVVDFFSSLAVARRVLVKTPQLMVGLTAIEQGTTYKLIAYPIRQGVLDGLYWSDDYIYDPGQASVEFTSGGSQGGSGEAKTFTGSVQIQGKGVSRRVVAIALDAEPPYLLAQTQSDTNGSYTLDWQGYSGQMLVTALDDYGTDFVAGMTLGVGDRVHPPYPNGYVYESANLGITGAEPTWPNKEGESVTSGEVQLVAVPFWRPKSSGPFSV